MKNITYADAQYRCHSSFLSMFYTFGYNIRLMALYKTDGLGVTDRIIVANRKIEKK